MRKKILIGAIIISGSGIGAYFLLSGSGKDVQYRTEKVATGNVNDPGLKAGACGGNARGLVDKEA